MDTPLQRWELGPADLDLDLDPAAFGFRTTSELEPLTEVVGQERARRALEVGLAVRQLGYNLYVSGISGTGKKQLIRELIQERTQNEPTPDDWVYVFNFDEPDHPNAFRLPSGQGCASPRLRPRSQPCLPCPPRIREEPGPGRRFVNPLPAV